MKPSPKDDGQKERESDWPVAPPSQSELPEGEYIAAYRGAERRQWFGQEKVRLLFEIVDPAPCAGIQIPLFATLQKKSSPRSKYFELWVKANGGPPLRGDRMSPRVFSGYWRLRIAWSVPKNGGHPMPQVVELLERVAGGVNKMLSDKAQDAIPFVNPSCRSRLKRQDSHRFTPPLLLPELRGEWVRKDLGKERKEFSRYVGLSERRSAARPECSRMCRSSVTAPVWGVNTHPSGSGWLIAIRGFSGQAGLLRQAAELGPTGKTYCPATERER